MIPICPNCSDSEMELDEMFPDYVVWRCPECFHRCTPATYQQEWAETMQMSLDSQKFGAFSRKCRLIAYTSIIVVALAALIYSLI